MLVSCLLHIAWGLTLARILLAGPILLLYNPSNPPTLYLCVALIMVAELTDHLDGILARRASRPSREGYIVDGLADRVFYTALILAITLYHPIQPLFPWLWISGQIAVYAIRLLQADWREEAAHIRLLHLLHWGGLRLWVLSYILEDLEVLGELFFQQGSALAYLRTVVFGASLILLYAAIADRVIVAIQLDR